MRRDTTAAAVRGMGKRLRGQRTGKGGGGFCDGGTRPGLARHGGQPARAEKQDGIVSRRSARFLGVGHIIRPVPLISAASSSPDMRRRVCYTGGGGEYAATPVGFGASAEVVAGLQAARGSNLTLNFFRAGPLCVTHHDNSFVYAVISRSLPLALPPTHPQAPPGLP